LATDADHRALLPTFTGRAFLSDASTIAPNDEQWPSEVFAERASQTLDQLKAALRAAEPASQPGRVDVSSFFTPDFSVELATDDPAEIFADSQITVQRIAEVRNPRRVESPDATTQFLQTLTAVPPVDERGSITIKVIQVQMHPAWASTVLRAESSWDGAQEAVQKTSQWACDWSLGDDGPRIAVAKLQSLEIVRRRGRSWMADATMTVVGASDAFRQQLAHGLQFWLARVETAHGMNYFSKHGLAVADINGDGLDDVYVCQPGGLPNRLFIQQAYGTAREQSARYGLDLLDRTSSALFVDLDNDGDQDVALATLMGVLICENVEQQRFEKRQLVTLPDIDLQGLSAVDYDNDGDLDLYQLVDFASATSRAQLGLPLFLYHDARDGGANRLLQNNIRGGPAGQWQFRDVTREVGLDLNNQRHSLAAAWEDFDNDGDQDLYVANDYGPNCLYRNDAGRFVDEAEAMGVVDFGSGMSVSWGDYNRDGLMDLYVGNMFSTAGSRITAQQQFLPTASQQSRQLYRRFARGNSLFRNQGGAFQETTDQAGVGMGRWSWSSLFADLNNDGWDDLLVANGYITTDDSGDL
jgi:hypothetical protein